MYYLVLKIFFTKIDGFGLLISYDIKSKESKSAKTSGFV